MRRDLNERARDRLRDQERLGDRELRVGTRGFSEGDRVVALRNNARLDVENGTTGTITRIREDRALDVAVDGGRTVTFPLEYLQAGHVDHGYALTVYKGVARWELCSLRRILWSAGCLSSIRGGEMGLVDCDDGWRLPDWLWERIEPLVPSPPAHPLGTHRRGVPKRRVMDAILLVLGTGMQWNALDATGVCNSWTAHRRFQEWEAAGVFHEIWRQGLGDSDEQVGIDWAWLAADGVMTKAPLGGEQTAPNPTDRAKKGRSVRSPATRRGSPSGSRMMALTAMT